MELNIAIHENRTYLVTGLSKTGVYHSCASCDKNAFLNQLALYYERTLNRDSSLDELFSKFEGRTDSYFFEEWAVYHEVVPAGAKFFVLDTFSSLDIIMSACGVYSTVRKGWLGFRKTRLSSEYDLFTIFNVDSASVLNEVVSTLKAWASQRAIQRSRTAEVLLLSKEFPTRPRTLDPMDWSRAEALWVYENEFKKWIISHDSRSDNRAAIIVDMETRGYNVADLRNNVTIDALFHRDESSRLWNYTGD